MKAATLEPAPLALGGRLADYVSLTKPRVSVLVLFTVAAGALLASAPAVPFLLVVHAVLGTALVAAGASALNQFLERHVDAQMRRTADRPLPAGRLAPVEVVAFGAALAVAGVSYLAVALPTPWAALAAAFTFAGYVGVYTPLKGVTTLNTLVGAVPGAMPPVIGWLAVGGRLDFEAVALFAILFLWQVPHFLAIAWIYRDEYARAGLRMLPTEDPEGVRTGRQMVLYCLALVPVSLAPALADPGRLVYLAGAVLLGLAFLASALGFRASPGLAPARRVLRLSLVYLPGLLLLLLIDRGLRALLAA